MKYSVTWEGFEPNMKEKAMVVEKMRKLDQLLKDVKKDLKMVMVRIKKRSRWGYEVKLELELPGKTLFAKEEGEDLVKNLIAARGQLERQIKEYFGKLRG